MRFFVRNFFKKLFPQRYEMSSMLNTYIVSQYGAFIKNRPVKVSEVFYTTVIDNISPYVKSNYTILDIGCAVGRLVFEYEKLGAKSIGIDSSSKFIEFCNKVQKNSIKSINFPIQSNTKTEFQCIDFKYYRSRDKIDVISCINIVDRVNNPYELMEVIYDLLKLNGILIIVDPYDWKLSPAPSELHFDNMKILFPNKKWKILKEVISIPYVMKINSKNDIVYFCHLIIAEKIL